nr:hypothetical protein [Nanoarchaeum sp.]
MENSTYRKAIANYKPLTKLEETYIGRRSFQGDVQARNVLVNHNLAKVDRAASAHAGIVVGYDDLVQEGNMFLLKTMGTFNPERGSLDAYSLREIGPRMNVHLKREERRAAINSTGHAEQLDQVVSESEDETLYLNDILTDVNAENPEYMAFRSELLEIIDSLPIRRAYVIKKVFYEDQTLETIGAELGITRQGVEYLKDKGLKQLRQQLLGRGLNYLTAVQGV